VEGLAAILRGHCRLAAEFAAWIDATSGFERMAPTQFSVVCFRRHPVHIDDESVLEQINQELMNHVNASGKCFIAGTTIRGRFFLRLAIGNEATSEKHVQNLRELMQEFTR
jgi:aromatic-L-amino-acid decarboxylase